MNLGPGITSTSYGQEKGDLSQASLWIEPSVWPLFPAEDSDIARGTWTDKQQVCAKPKEHPAAGREKPAESGFSVLCPLETAVLVLHVAGVPMEMKSGEGWKEEG